MFPEHQTEKGLKLSGESGLPNPLHRRLRAMCEKNNSKKRVERDAKILKKK